MATSSARFSRDAHRSKPVPLVAPCHLGLRRYAAEIRSNRTLAVHWRVMDLGVARLLRVHLADHAEINGHLRIERSAEELLLSKLDGRAAGEIIERPGQWAFVTGGLACLPSLLLTIAMPFTVNFPLALKVPLVLASVPVQVIVTGLLLYCRRLTRHAEMEDNIFNTSWAS